MESIKEGIITRVAGVTLSATAPLVDYGEVRDIVYSADKPSVTAHNVIQASI